MPRQSLKIGQWGEISYTKTKTGYRARTLHRDLDGIVRPVERSGVSKSKARANLLDHLEERSRDDTNSSTITPYSTISELADAWLAEQELDDGVQGQSITQYRQEIEPAAIRDKRATATDTKIKVALGNIKVRELTTTRVDQHLTVIIARGHKAKAKLQRWILKDMMALAVRKGARPDNPVREMATIRQGKKSINALEVEQLTRLRAQLRTWLSGKEIPGTPAFTTGVPRNPKIVQAADILMATGARPGEVLALRFCDINTETTPWQCDINATVVYVKGEGMVRQPHTKTGESGRRIVHLPQFAIDVIKQIMADNPRHKADDLLLPSNAGTLWYPNNFNRAWRQARGSEFSHVTAKTFRATVATLIAQEAGLPSAGHQLGHEQGSKVTARHYAKRKHLAPDSTAIISKAWDNHGSQSNETEDTAT